MGTIPLERPHLDGTMRRPVNRVVAIATSGGDNYDYVVRYKPSNDPRVPDGFKIGTPPPRYNRNQRNFLGLRYGGMRVVGWLKNTVSAGGNHRGSVWVVLCSCGQLERRRHRAINKWLYEPDSVDYPLCGLCHKKEWLRRNR